MNKKSFFLGVVTGVVLTFVILFIIGWLNMKSGVDNQIQYLENPVSYENKAEASFEISQVIGEAALAREASDNIGGDVLYYGNTVLIFGKNFYSDQKITIKNPMRIGTFSYTTNGGLDMTVPVIEGKISE